MRMKRHLVPYLLSLASIVTIACGGSSNSTVVQSEMDMTESGLDPVAEADIESSDTPEVEVSGDSFTVTQIPGISPDENGRYLMAFVSSENFPSSGGQVFSASVYALTDAPDLLALTDGECIVVDGGGASGASTLHPSSNSSESISAGTAVVSSNGTTILTLSPNERNTYYNFTNDTGLAQPRNIVWSFTGGEAPAFEVTIPNIEPLQMRTDIASGTFTVDSVYEWIASPDPSDYIVVRGSIRGDTEPFDTLLSYSCRTEDDGEFRLPERVANQIGSGVEIAFVGISRNVSEFQVVNNIAVDLRQVSAH